MANKPKQQAGGAGAGTQGAATAATTQDKVSKKEAVRRALKALGKGATPSALRPWIKQQFGIEMSNDHISTAKGEILRGKGGKGKTKAAGQARTAARQPARPAAPLSSGPGPAAGTVSLDDVRLVKALVARVGPGQLRGLLDLLAR
jgi:hypothetical protein